MGEVLLLPQTALRRQRESALRGILRKAIIKFPALLLSMNFMLYVRKFFLTIQIIDAINQTPD